MPNHQLTKLASPLSGKLGEIFRSILSTAGDRRKRQIYGALLGGGLGVGQGLASGDSAKNVALKGAGGFLGGGAISALPFGKADFIQRNLPRIGAGAALGGGGLLLGSRLGSKPPVEDVPQQYPNNFPRGFNV
jgi:hypothetical protein